MGGKNQPKESPAEAGLPLSVHRFLRAIHDCQYVDEPVVAVVKESGTVSECKVNSNANRVVVDADYGCIDLCPEQVMVTLGEAHAETVHCSLSSADPGRKDKGEFNILGASRV
jgi:hypothetical protein